MTAFLLKKMVQFHLELYKSNQEIQSNMEK